MTINLKCPPELDDLRQRQSAMRFETEMPLERLPLLNASRRFAAILLQELLVQQFELGQLSKQLREIEAALQNSRDRYSSLYEFAPVAILTLSASGQITEANQSAVALLDESLEHLRHSDFVSMVDHKDQNYWIQCFEHAIKRGGKRENTLILRRKNGSFFNGNLHYSLLGQNPGSQEMLIVLTDVSPQKKAKSKARSSLEQRCGELQQKCDAESLTTTEQEWMHLFFPSQIIGVNQREPERRGAVRTAELCTSNQRQAFREREFRTLAESSPDNIVRYDRSAVITYVNPMLERTIGVAAADLVGARVRDLFSDGSFEVYAQALDTVLATGKSIEMEVFMPDPRQRSDEVHQIRFVAERDEYGAVIGALAIGRDISTLKRSERELKASRRQLRGLIASREAALETERKRIAREVHDELGQLLTGLQMKVSRLARKYVSNCPEAKAHLEDTLVLSEKALSVARNVATALRPAVLDMGIVTALEWLADKFSKNTGVPCQVCIVDDDIRLTESQAISLFRMAQESLTNVARHAQADLVEISLEKNADEYILKIGDNGVGFDNALKKYGSFGLVGIQERALMLGGVLDIDTRLGFGTKIVVRIPTQERLEVR